jgi:hypothetical protein
MKPTHLHLPRPITAHQFVVDTFSLPLVCKAVLRCIGKVVKIGGVCPQLFDAFDRVSHEQFKLVVDTGYSNNTAAPGSNVGELMVDFLVEGTSILVR